MNKLNLFFALFLGFFIAVPSIAQSKDATLTFVKKIGTGGGGWMSFVSFSPDGTMVAADGSAVPGAKLGDFSPNLSVWSFPTGNLIKSLPGQPWAISRDWKYYGRDHGVAEMASGKMLISTDAEFSKYVFSPNGHYVVGSARRLGAEGTRIQVWELPSGKEVLAFGAHYAHALAISPDGMTLASGHWDEVLLWNLSTGTRVATLRGVGRYADGLSFSPDGRLLAVGTDTGGLQIWDVRQRIILQSIAMGGGYVSDPQFSPDGRLVAVGIYATGTAWLIDVGHGRVVGSQKISEFGCGSVAFSPNGRFLIAPSTGGGMLRRGKWRHEEGGTIRVFKVNAP